MSQIMKVLLFTFGLTTAFFIKNTYVSNSELEDLRHTHLATFRNSF